MTHPAFDALAAVEAVQEALAPAMKARGFRRSRAGFRRQAGVARFELGFPKARSNSPTSSSFSMAAGVYLPALDPLYRGRDFRTIIPLDGPEFDRNLAALTAGRARWWEVRDATSLATAVAQAEAALPAALAFFADFDTEAKVLEALRSQADAIEPARVAVQFKYPAWLALSGRGQESGEALDALRALYAGDADALRHLGTFAGRLARTQAALAG
jgi:hypothetical protein